MEDHELTTLERAVFAEMAQRNPGTTPEMIYGTSTHNDWWYIFHYYSHKARPPLVDISPLVRLRTWTRKLFSGWTLQIMHRKRKPLCGANKK